MTPSEAIDASIPEGFARHPRRSPLTEPWEPIYAKITPDAFILGIRLATPHTNSRGLVHGGLIAALADNAMGLSAVRQARRTPGGEKASAVTVSLALDFIDATQVGDCLEVHPMLLKLGRTLAFMECRVVCGERLVARASATFRMVSD